MPAIHQSTPQRMLRRAAIGLIAAIAATLVIAMPAQASVKTVACTLGSNTATYNPPLTNVPQDTVITRDIHHKTCVSTEPGLHSGTVYASALAPNRSCLELVGQGKNSSTIVWNTGQTSTYTASSNATIAGAVYTVTTVGVVTDGLFKNQTLTTNSTGLATDILTCTLGLGTVRKIDTVVNMVIAPV